MRFRLRCQTIFCGVLLLPVVVGKDVQISVAGTSFAPPNIGANIGDNINILFTVGNARFTQSSLDNPCTPLQGGLDSGDQPVPPGAGPKQFNFAFTQSPIYYFNFFGGQTNNCRNGFVGAIGASATQMNQFLQNAENFLVEPTVAASSITVPPNTSITFPSSSNVDKSSPPVSTASPGSQTQGATQTKPSTNPGLTPSPNSPPPSTASNPKSGTPFPNSSASKTSISSPSSTTSGHSSTTPGHSSTTASSGTSPLTTPYSPSSRQAIVALIGGLLAMTGFGLVLLGFFFIRKRRARAQLALISAIDPYSRNPKPRVDTLSIQSESSSFLLRHFTSALSIRSRSIRSMLTWKRLEDEERGGGYTSSRPSYQSTVNILETPLLPPMPPPKAWLPKNDRRASDATLVLSVRSGESDLTDASLIVHMPGYREKNVDLTAYRFSSGSIIDVNASPEETFPLEVKDGIP
ncbi:hypothetical protein M422DRAFT_38843 [Sphaerobolus stellatus SS14]|uniref:Uncharacterized protein n=1 Tax=Sphaerobolus stellatus (strain SS14) TaxID=990650 RepID=A0A0C9T8E6_SPHS4|nr:hypothetical protein M422DRAFT_38843 [Sphaerobolus stellatus SS14]